jgi:hypothetical protein
MEGLPGGMWMGMGFGSWSGIYSVMLAFSLDKNTKPLFDALARREGPAAV